MSASEDFSCFLPPTGEHNGSRSAQAYGPERPLNLLKPALKGPNKRNGKRIVLPLQGCFSSFV